MIDSRPMDPTPRQVRQFGYMLAAFAALLGALTWWRGEMFLGIGVFLAAAVLVSWAIRYRSIGRQLTGAFLPLMCLAIGGSIRAGADPALVAVIIWVVGALAVAATLGAPALGRAIFLGWMQAAEPIGWTISTLLLAGVYYLVITPLGLMLRLAGRDPLERKIDRDADSYWHEHRPSQDAAAYFKQY